MQISLSSPLINLLVIANRMHLKYNKSNNYILVDYFPSEELL